MCFGIEPAEVTYHFEGSAPCRDPVPREVAPHNGAGPALASPAVDIGRPALGDVRIDGVQYVLHERPGGYAHIPDGEPRHARFDSPLEGQRDEPVAVIEEVPAVVIHLVDLHEVHHATDPAVEQS